MFNYYVSTMHYRPNFFIGMKGNLPCIKNNTNYNENTQQNNLKKIGLCPHSNWPSSKHKILFVSIWVDKYLFVFLHVAFIVLELFWISVNLNPSWISAKLKILKVTTCKTEQQPTNPPPNKLRKTWISAILDQICTKFQW